MTILLECFFVWVVHCHAPPCWFMHVAQWHLILLFSIYGPLIHMQCVNKKELACHFKKKILIIKETGKMSMKALGGGLCLDWTWCDELGPHSLGVSFSRWWLVHLHCLQTPRIVEATTDRQRVFDMPASSDVVKEGMLSCKMAISDGKVHLVAWRS